MDYNPKEFPIGLFESHIKPFGASSQLRPNYRSVFIKEKLGLYKKPLSVRPEFYDNLQIPLGEKKMKPSESYQGMGSKPKKKKKAKKSIKNIELSDDEEFMDTSKLLEYELLNLQMRTLD